MTITKEDLLNLQAGIKISKNDIFKSYNDDVLNGMEIIIKGILGTLDMQNAWTITNLITKGELANDNN